MISCLRLAQKCRRLPSALLSGKVNTAMVFLLAKAMPSERRTSGVFHAAE